MKCVLIALAAFGFGIILTLVVSFIVVASEASKYEEGNY